MNEMQLVNEYYLLSEMERLQAELQRYKQLEDEGRLVELPYPVGTIMYEVTSKARCYRCGQSRCKSDEMPRSYCYRTIIDKLYMSLAGWEYIEPRLNKSIFLTREAAEKALKEGEGNDK